jgi:hypothetical protein
MYSVLIQGGIFHSALGWLQSKEVHFVWYNIAKYSVIAFSTYFGVSGIL